MSDTPEPTAPETSPAQRTPFLLMVLRRPFEFLLIGLGVVGVLFVAQRANVLPERFAGVGVEVEFDVEQLQENTGATVQELVGLNARIDELQAELAALRATLEPVGAPAFPRLAVDEEAVLEEVLVVEDQAPQTSNLLEDGNVEGSGVVWLGTWAEEEQIWTDQSISIAGLSAGLPPPQDLVDQSATLTTNLNVREQFPADTEAYYRGVRALGVSNTGTTALITAPPRLYQRDSGVQVWAEVSLTYQPYIGVQRIDTDQSESP